MVNIKFCILFKPINGMKSQWEPLLKVPLCAFTVMEHSL